MVRRLFLHGILITCVAFSHGSLAKSPLCCSSTDNLQPESRQPYDKPPIALPDTIPTTEPTLPTLDETTLAIVTDLAQQAYAKERSPNDLAEELSSQYGNQWQVVPFEGKSGYFNSKSLEQLHGNLQNRHGFVAFCPEQKRMVISYRGTQDLLDTISDLAAHQSDLTRIGLDGRGHSGFVEAFLSSAEQMFSIVTELLAAHHLSASDVHMITTGHSYGKSRAVLAAAYLKNRLLANNTEHSILADDNFSEDYVLPSESMPTSALKITVVVYGGARDLDSTAARHIENLLGKHNILLFYSPTDPVTMVPLTLPIPLGNYADYGTAIPIPTLAHTWLYLQKWLAQCNYQGIVSSLKKSVYYAATAVGGNAAISHFTAIYVSYVVLCRWLLAQHTMQHYVETALPAYQAFINAARTPAYNALEQQQEGTVQSAAVVAMLTESQCHTGSNTVNSDTPLANSQPAVKKPVKKPFIAKVKSQWAGARKKAKTLLKKWGQLVGSSLQPLTVSE